MLIHFRVTMNTRLGYDAGTVSKRRAGGTEDSADGNGPEVIPIQGLLTQSRDSATFRDCAIVPGPRLRSGVAEVFHRVSAIR